MAGLTIGRLAEAAGVGVPTVRYYERRALLEKPHRTAAGYRKYPPDTVRLIRFIKRAQDLGFTLTEIEGLIALRAGNGRRRTEVRQLAEARMRDIDEKVTQLQAMRSALSTLVDSCACGGGQPTCPILEAFDDPINAATQESITSSRTTHVQR
ncbi:MAG TPA: MerR family DNA-binding protein [Gemmatimonadaceae bacterium]|nr:MerR family DNA-binding protein [Gemmatimonadaceae bacterium]